MTARIEGAVMLTRDVETEGDFDVKSFRTTPGCARLVFEDASEGLWPGPINQEAIENAYVMHLMNMRKTLIEMIMHPEDYDAYTNTAFEKERIVLTVNEEQ